MNTPELIYTAGGNREYVPLALARGMSYGVQLPDTCYFPPVFADQNYFKPDRARYMKMLAEHRPRMATVLDLEYHRTFDEVMDWANEASQYVTESVILIPKVHGSIAQFPREINGKEVVLGYSVKTSHGCTTVNFHEFRGWKVHLLGGNTHTQIMLAARGLNVVSTDSNIWNLHARAGRFWTAQPIDAANRRYPTLTEAGMSHITENIPLRCLDLTFINVLAAWQGTNVMLRYGTESDVDAIMRIAHQYPQELGYVMPIKLRERMAAYEVYVAIQHDNLVGFVCWHKRRDGWATIYEIAVDKRDRGNGIGKALLNAVPRPTRLKCTVDNPANQFYAAQGMTLDRTEAGKKRPLNVWIRC